MEIIHTACWDPETRRVLPLCLGVPYGSHNKHQLYIYEYIYYLLLQVGL
jgi:hypothetical protein